MVPSCTPHSAEGFGQLSGQSWWSIARAVYKPAIVSPHGYSREMAMAVLPYQTRTRIAHDLMRTRVGY